MALKFLNKKGWHTGSLRNIENVWKAEQKHDAEQKKLEELKKQIKEEREAQEFRILQEQAGLAPKQERLEFLYDSGLAVGKTTTDEYLLGKPLEETKETELEKVADGPGALFVSKPQSANDAWRKLHSDPLLLIRQQEQAALAVIKSNPVKMDMIRKEIRDRSKENDLREKKRKHKRKVLKKKKGKLRDESDGDEAASEEEDIGHSKRKSRDTRQKFKDSHSDSSSGGEEEDVAYSEHRSKERHRNLKDSRGESSSSEGDAKHSKKKRRELKQTNLGSDKKSDRIFEQKSDDRWRSGSERRAEAGPEPSDTEKRKLVASERSDGNVERRHEDRGVKGRDEERSHERQLDDSRWRYGSSRRSYRSPDRKHHDARLHDGNGRSPDSNDHDRRWRDGSGRRNGRSPVQRHYAERHSTSENGRSPARSPARSRDDTRWRDVARRNETSPERMHYEGRNQGGYARNDGGKSSSEALASSLREKKSEVLQDEQVAGQSNKRLSEAPVQNQRKSKLSEAEKAARLKEMQVDAELHEEQRWQRLKKGAEADARDSELSKQTAYGQGKSFIDDTNRSVFGAENTTNASLSESVRRRAHYRDRRAADGQSNAFRR